jgi:predicted ATPase/class 3 adenylate cyclase
MTSEDPAKNISQLEQAIAIQETLRGTVADSIIEATISALRQQIHQLSQEDKPDEQRKVVTILFMDVVESTQLLLDIDPEDHMEVMDSALRQLAEPIEAHGGRLNRFMGDGYMAVFGLPRAKENDPEMAVRAGLAVLQKAQSISQTLEAERGLQNFQVRVGINTGQVMAGGYTEAEHTIMGTAVNLAARIESAAPPGGLMISQDTYQHIRGLFNIEKADLVKMKGFGEVVPVYLVKGAKPHTFHATTRGIEGVETPMIGRAEELNTLQRAIEAIETQPDCRFVTIIGEAGLGKSRLLKEFETWLEQRENKYPLFKGRATLETVDLPYGLLRDLFASQFEILEDDTIPIVRDKIRTGFERYVEHYEDVELAADLLGHLFGYQFSHSPHLEALMDSPRQLKERGVHILTIYLKAAATNGPIAIFLDDIHWSDESSLDIFIHLFKQFTGLPVLFVALSRPTLMERRPNWGKLDQHMRLDLHALTTEASQQLVGKVLNKVDNIPDDLSKLIVKNAEGNPYYLEELIKMLIEDGVVDTSQPIWKIQADRLDNLRIPATLTGVLQARLDSLPVEEHAILQQASVVGRVFWQAAISYVCENNVGDESFSIAGPDEIEHHLEMLQQREMIIENKAPTFSNTREFSFIHTIQREVTYESVLLRTRRYYHSLIANWLIDQRKERSGELSGLIASHLEKAGKTEQALEYLCQAAEAAQNNYAIDEASDFYRRALALTPASEPERKFSLLLGSERAFAMKGNIDRQQKTLEELSKTANLLDDDHKRAEVLIRKAWFDFFRSNFLDMQKAAEQAAALIKTTPDQTLEGQAYYALGWANMLQDNLSLALVYAQKALPLAQKTHDKRSIGNTLSLIGTLQSKAGDLMGSFQNLQGALKISRELKNQERELTAMVNLSVIQTMIGNPQEAQNILEYCLEIGREKGDPNLISTSLINLAWATSSQEKWAIAKAYADEGIHLKRMLGQKEAMAEGLNWLGNTLLGQGKPEAAIEAFEASNGVRREIALTHLTLEGTAGLAKASLELGDLHAARQYVEEILLHLDQGNSILRVWEPLQIYWRCYAVLKSLQDKRADELLNDAYHILIERAEKLPEGDIRTGYLTNIISNRNIFQSWTEKSIGA